MFCISFILFAKIRLSPQEEIGPLLGDQGGLLYKTPLTASVFNDFSSAYQKISSPTFSSSLTPFVYVDSVGVKLVTGIVDEERSGEDGFFALSVAEDGFVEMLAFQDAV